MFKTMRIMTFFALILLGIQANADLNHWTVTVETDAMTDETKKSLSVENSLGHQVAAYPDSEGNLWLTYSLGGMDQFSPERPPMVRIDKYPAHDMTTNVEFQDMLKGIGKPKLFYDWNPKFINVRETAALDGVLPVGNPKSMITQLMSGQKMVLRYWLGTGGYKDTEFTLQGFSDEAGKVFDMANEKE